MSADQRRLIRPAEIEEADEQKNAQKGSFAVLA
jgi:hypothetical protein